MEEKKPQELPMDEETTEEVTEEVTDQAEADAVETEAAEGEVSAPEASENSIGAEPIEESVEESVEKSIETEPEAEEIVAHEGVAETLDEAKPAEADDEATTEESTAEESTAEEVKDTPTKVATKGFVVQTWQLAIAAIIVVAMVAGGVLLGVLLGNRGDTDDFNGSPVDYDWVLPQGSNPGANQIVVPGYGDLLFTAGQKQIEMILPNPQSNPCYFRYTLVLEDTGEILYQSPLIAPGKAVLEIELSRALSKGDYHLTIAIDSIAIADGRTPMNGAEHHVLLQVR